MQTARPKRSRFTPAVLRQARSIAASYDLILRYEDDEWYAHALEYPEAMGDGKTPQQCVRATRQVLTVALATMIEAGQTPPPPAREGIRTEQVNVRLTAEEKTLLESKARRKGYRGLSDFIRAAVITHK